MAERVRTEWVERKDNERKGMDDWERESIITLSCVIQEKLKQSQRATPLLITFFLCIQNKS
jgi:hypothetical protein